MRNRSGIQGVASSPILVGAVTILVVIIAVFLAYNANNGLPFVSTYNLKVKVPNADALVKGNEVRIGGVRVGIVKSVVPEQESDGTVFAELSLSLDKNAEPLPVDSTVTIRPKSALGLKFLQVTPGDSSKGFKPGETIPLTAYTPEPVDIDEFFDTFDEPTRKAIRQNQAGFGNALAGRGPQLNEAIGALRRLVVNGQPVLRTIVEPSSNFAGFWRALEDLSATVAPVAETQASLFVALDRTFAAFARVSRPYIQETIEKGPPTLDAVNADLPAVRPFFRDSGRFFAALRPGAKALGDTSPVIAKALHAGVPALNASPVLNNQLTPTAEALVAFQEAPGVFNGLNLLVDTNELLKPALKFIAPSQTQCNYITLAFKNLANSNSEGNDQGNWLNILPFVPAEGPNSESSPASAPANGPTPANHLHFNPYPNTGAPGQSHGCEAGNEKYLTGTTVIGNAANVWATTTRGQVKKK
ncbi:MAG: phospholipid/cholesterol/gamma-HCH transport system substrate-binding protein [Solirubrobacterales bacterium]|jgi:virulence factor Mce-like protein|nr:phospholipid/cholesterol/gamma-HCH transport system substrate-binding protein [Solirubrobacterales bacterium]